MTTITFITHRVRRAYPGAEIRIAFTSHIITNIWDKRRNDAVFLKKHKDIPPSILNVKGPLTTITDLHNEGYKVIIIQPAFIYEGQEYIDLASGLIGVSHLFRRLVLGRPLLGVHGMVNKYCLDIRCGSSSYWGQQVRERLSILYYNKFPQAELVSQSNACCCP